MNRVGRWALLALIAVLLAAQQIFTVPGDSRFAMALHNSMHVPWFALVTLVLTRLLGWRVGLAVALLLAFGSEAFQALTGRRPSFIDVARDVLGALLVVAYLLWRNSGQRLASGLLALSVLCITAYPLVEALKNKFEVQKLFPVLLASEESASVYFLKSPSEIYGDDEGVRFRLTHRKWSGIHITEPVADWSGYKQMHVALAIEAGEALPLYVSVRQGKTGGPTGFARFKLESGLHELQVPLAKLLIKGSAPVDDVFIYSRGHFAGREITLKRVFLTR